MFLTGYEKDQETGLDFAEARYYQNKHGRFTAVDPLLASGKSANPQTFNRYAYVGNNPLSRTDPTGMDWWYQTGQSCGKGCKLFTAEWFDKDPGGGYRRWTDHAGYISKITYGENVGRYAALYSNGYNDFFNTEEEATAAYNEHERGLVPGTNAAARDYLAGFSSGGSPFGIIQDYIAEKSGKIDTSSRDYLLGEAAGIILGAAISGGLNAGGQAIKLSEAKSLVKQWAPDAVQGTRAASIEYHFAEHQAEVGAKNLWQYLRKAQGFAQNLKGATSHPVEGATEGVTRYIKNGKYIDLTADKKIISFGSVN
jgi:RHS repeat-associated protein